MSHSNDPNSLKIPPKYAKYYKSREHSSSIIIVRKVSDQEQKEKQSF